MPLDPMELKAQADAHLERLAGPDWNDDDLSRGPETVKVPGLYDDSSPVREDRKPVRAQAPASSRGHGAVCYPDCNAPPGRYPDPPPCSPWSKEHSAALRALQQQVSQMRDELGQLAPDPLAAQADHDLPPWLLAAAGDPHDFDGRDPSRTSTCVRIVPATYARLKNLQVQLGVRTVAATWEYVLRLGLAAAEARSRG
ncbi:MAG: hypothetical protein KKI08_25690 [Armatimonadetes bacterium]|nr:hypothetical protein [Armatimonadota bacterium]